MRKRLSLILAAALAIALIASCWTNAFAATTLSMMIGEEEPLEISNETITSAYTSDNTVVLVDRIASGRAYVKALAPGTATITVYYTSGGTGRSYEFRITVVGTTNTTTNTTGTPKVTVNLASVGDFDMSTEVYFNVSSMRSSNERVCKAAFINNIIVITATGEGSAVVTYDGYRNNQWESAQIQVNVGSTAITGNTTTPNGTDITLKVGETWSTQSFYATTVVRSDNDNVARVSTDSTGRNVITAVGIGTTNISYAYRTVADGPLTYVTHQVAVTATGSNNSTTTPGTQNISLLVGNSYNTSRYQIVSVSSSNSNVALATITSTTLTGSNAMDLRIQALAVGTATVQMEYYDANNSVKQTQTFDVVVSSDGSSTTNNTPTTPTSNISFVKTAYTIAKYNAAGQIVPYRLNPRVNGTSVTADTMLWLSTDTSVFTVESTTGIIRGVKAGTARLICIDKNGDNMAAVTLTVTN